MSSPNEHQRETTHRKPCLSLAKLKVVNMSPEIIRERVLLTCSRDWCLINAWLMFSSGLGNISNIISPFANCTIRGYVHRANSGIMVVAVLSTLLTECIRSGHEQLEIELTMGLRRLLLVESAYLCFHTKCPLSVLIDSVGTRRRPFPGIVKCREVPLISS